MKPSVQSPEKELRFTRSGQAVIFWLLAAMLAGTAATLGLTSLYRDINPDVPHPAWMLLPLFAVIFLLRLAVRMTRHAYLILTPMGVEIFPLWRPEQGMRLVLWQEIDAVEFDDRMTRMTLHFDAAKTSGVHVTLRPIRACLRAVLAKAVMGRVGAQSAIKASDR
jgi:hypothetical protein